MLSGPPRLVPFIFAAFALAVVVWYYRGTHGSGASLSTWKPGNALSSSRPPSLRPGVDPLDFSIPLRFSDGPIKPVGTNYTFKIVVPKTTKEDLKWMEEEIPHAPLVVYEVDNEKAEHKVPKNKGREAMVCREPAQDVAVGCADGANSHARSISATSSTTTTTSPTRPCSCTPTAMPGTTTSSWAWTPPRSSTA